MRIPTQSECLSYGYYGFAIYLMSLFTLEVWILVDHPELVNTSALVIIMAYPAAACANLYFKRSWRNGKLTPVTMLILALGNSWLIGAMGRTYRYNYLIVIIWFVVMMYATYALKRAGIFEKKNSSD